MSELPALVVLDVHTPRYRRLFRHALRSHKLYAERFGYEYRSVKMDRENAAEAKWQKLSSTSELLESHDLVLLLDADCFVMQAAPDIRQELVEGRDIYMAKGRSGRFNSGVMLIRSTDAGRSFISDLIEGRGKIVVDAANSVSEAGENGAVIQLSQAPAYAQLVSTLINKWNENRVDGSESYIVHFTSGPLRGASRVLRSRFARVPLLGNLVAYRPGQRFGVPMG